MSSEWYRISQFLIFLPLYLTAFVGIGRVLRLRRTHPRACWYSVAAGTVLFLNWALTAAGGFVMTAAEATGLTHDLIWIVFAAMLSALQTTAAVLVIAAILTGRSQSP